MTKRNNYLPVLRQRQQELMNPFLDWFDAALVDFFNDWGPFNSSIVKNKTYPKVDISEVGNDIVVEAVIPFVKKEDLNVSLDNGILTISGEIHKTEAEEKKYYRRELSSRSSFIRSFPIEEDIWSAWIKDLGDDISTLIDAQFKDGVLTIILKGILSDKTTPQIRPPTQIEIKEIE